MAGTLATGNEELREIPQNIKHETHWLEAAAQVKPRQNLNAKYELG